MAELSKEQVDKFKREGFLKISGILNENEVKELSNEYDILFDEKKNEGGRLEAKWAGDWKGEGNSVLSIHNLQQHSAIFTKLLLHSKLLDCLQQLIGGDSIVLHHTKAHTKPPLDGTSFPAHQDYHYFPHSSHSMLAVFICLDSMDPKNGGLAVFPGSHLEGPLKDVCSVEGTHFVSQEDWPLESGVPVCADAGDVVVFSYLTVHSSYPNKSERVRRMFLLQVKEGSDEAVTSQHQSPGAGMVLRGRNKKQIADLDMRHLDKDKA